VLLGFSLLLLALSVYMMFKAWSHFNT